MTPSDDSSLPDGLQSVFLRIRPQLLRFVAARCGDGDLAEDLVQDMWLKLQSIQAGPISNPVAYLHRMANNQVLDYRRLQRRAMARDHGWLAAQDPAHSLATNALHERPDPSTGAEDAMIEEEERKVLRAAIASLPEGARRALVLYRFEGHRQDKIAQIMGISRSGVEKHLALAMRKLREHLGSCGYFDLAASNDKNGQTMAPRRRNNAS